MKITILAILALLTSCSETVESEIITSDPVVQCSQTQTLQNGVCVDNGSGNPVTGPTCAGDSSDSTTNEMNGGFPKPSIHSLPVFLSGYEDWAPKEVVSNDDPTNLSWSTAEVSFQTDDRLRVRFKVKPQVRSTGSEQLCFDRQTNQILESVDYSKIWLSVGLRDLYWTNGPGSSKAMTSTYAQRIIGPIDVDQCSPIVELGSSVRANVVINGVAKDKIGTVVVLEDARDDVACQTNGTLCNGGRRITRKMCWGVTLQVATDSTQNFK